MAVDRAHREGAILLSLGTLTELFEVLSRKQFRGYIDEEDICGVFSLSWVFRARLMRRRHTYPLALGVSGGIGMLSTHLPDASSPLESLSPRKSAAPLKSSPPYDAA